MTSHQFTILKTDRRLKTLELVKNYFVAKTGREKAHDSQVFDFLLEEAAYRIELKKPFYFPTSSPSREEIV